MGLAGHEATAAMWDHEGLLAISARLVKLVREAGALAELPLHLYSLGVANTWTGDFAGAAAIAEEQPALRRPRESLLAIHVTEAPVAPGSGSRGLCFDSWSHPENRGFWGGDISDPGALGGCCHVQRSRPL